MVNISSPQTYAITRNLSELPCKLTRSNAQFHFGADPGVLQTASLLPASLARSRIAGQAKSRAGSCPVRIVASMPRPSSLRAGGILVIADTKLHLTGLDMPEGVPKGPTVVFTAFRVTVEGESRDLQPILRTRCSRLPRDRLQIPLPASPEKLRVVGLHCRRVIPARHHGLGDRHGEPRGGASSRRPAKSNRAPGCPIPDFMPWSAEFRRCIEARPRRQKNCDQPIWEDRQE
jgi:hypothetical protein